MLSLSFYNSLAQQPLSGADSACKLIDTMLNFARHNSLYRKQVNWPLLTDSVKKASANAQSVKAVMPAVQLFYQLLGDYHGFAAWNGKYYRWRRKSTKLDTVVYKSLIAKYKQDGKPESRLLAKGYGYLLIPENNPTHYGDDDRFAQQLQDTLQKLHPEKLKGLVIDLRTNPGGDMYPMILGVANLLGEGQLGAFIDPVNNQQEPWGIKGLSCYGGNHSYCTLKSIGKSATKLKVVILISHYTASSGEATAISFKGRPNTKFMGEPSGGYTTSNQSFQFLGIGVFMAASIEADRTGRIYPDNLVPDDLIQGGDNYENLLKDKKIITALKWLGR